MTNFIIFNTISQAKNYVKRQYNYFHRESCGCCSQGQDTSIEGNRVVAHSYGETRGQVYHEVFVIGRIKRGVSASN